MHHTLYILSLLLLCSQVFATCVVIVRNEKEILIGQDSRRHYVFNDNKKPKLIDDFLKIRETNGFFYTLVGPHDVMQIDIAEFVGNKVKNLEEFSEGFGVTLARNYETYLEGMRANNPKMYHGLFPDKSKNLVTEIAVFKIEDGKPHYYKLTFYNANLGDGPLRIRVDRTENEPICVLGYNDVYYKAPQSEKLKLDKLVENNPRLFIETIIQKEGKSYPNIVGGTTYILSLTDNQKKWAPKEPPVSKLSAD